MKRPALSSLVLVACAAAGARAQPVGSELRANTYLTGPQQRPSVAAAADMFVVVWESKDQDGSSYGIFGQRFSTAPKPAPLGGEFRVNTTTSGAQRYPAVAADASGNFVVVWQSPNFDSFPSLVLGQRYSSTGAPLGSEFRVNTYTSATGSIARPAVSCDAAGAFVVVWTTFGQGGDPSYSIAGQRYSSAGAPLGTQFRVNTYTPFDQRYPAVAFAAGGGSFVVAWQYTAYSADEVYARRYAATGEELGAEFLANTYTTFNQSRPSVASDAAGNFTVVWHGYDQDGHTDIFGQRFSSTGSLLGGEFRVNPNIGGDQVRPSVASDDVGNLTVVWQTSGAFPDIFGQRFLSTGAPNGTEFKVDSYTVSNNRYPRVAASGGGFVVAWQRLPDDPINTDTGVYAKRYPGQGDINGDGKTDVADVFYLINFLFAGGPAPVGFSDLNADGKTDVADVFYLINYLFAGGPIPK
jgi:hypothetical protein